MTQTAPGYWQPVRHYPPVPTTARRRLGTGGLLTSLAGVIAVAVSFTALPWFTGDSVHVGSDHSGRFGIVHDALIRVTLGSGFQVEGEPLAAMYFAWLGWALLVGVGFAAVLANLPTRAAPAFRVIGGVLALGAVALTFAALDLLSVRPGADFAEPGYGEYLSHAGSGVWVAVIGFVLLAGGAAIGPRSRR